MKRSSTGLVAAMCLSEVLTMLSFSSFAALLPAFKAIWALSNTEAGWISGIFFAGYTASVPVLVSLTDRVDPKRIWLVAGAITLVSNAGFALLADGFWSAMLFRALAGIGLAGTYMPGLKALSDHVGGSAQSRSVAFYTSSFGIGAAISFPLAGWLAAGFDWRWAFGVAALGNVAALALVALALPRAAPHAIAPPATALLDFRPVLRNRSALAYMLCYTVHNWELFGLRSWAVAFLVFVEAQHGAAPGLLAPTMIAFAMTLLGVPSSVFGNESSIRFGRRRTVAVAMAASALVCFGIGFSSAVSYMLAALLCLMHGITVAAESASVTAGALGNAAPGYRGATMALHSTLGFAGGFVGPLVFGLVLDLAGGQSVLAWGIAFAHMGAVMLLGPLAIRLLRPSELPGDAGARRVKAA